MKVYCIAGIKHIRYSWLHKAHVLLEINYLVTMATTIWSSCIDHIIMSALFTKVILYSRHFCIFWKASPRKFVTRTHMHVILQTVVSMKHVAAAIAILIRLQGWTPCLSSACCCRFCVRQPTTTCESSLCHRQVHPTNECILPTSVSRRVHPTN